MGIVKSSKTSNDIDELRILKRNGLRGVIAPVHFFLPGTTAGTAANFETTFFTAHRSYEVLSVYVRYSVAGSSGATLMLKRVPDGKTVTNGDDLLSKGIPLDGTVAEVQEGTVKQDRLDTRIIDRQGLGIETTGTITNLADLSVSVLLRAL